jgi:hypothetical protein
MLHTLGIYYLLFCPSTLGFGLQLLSCVCSQGCEPCSHRAFQIWIHPATMRTQPSYEQIRFDPEEKKNKLKRLARSVRLRRNPHPANVRCGRFGNMSSLNDAVALLL